MRELFFEDCVKLVVYTTNKVVAHSPKSLDENTVFLLGMASKLIYDRVVEIFRSGRFGITVEQFSILGILWYREGIRQQDIAEAVRRDKTTVARVINTMIRHGLLYRRADEGDKRTKLVFLTQRGKKPARSNGQRQRPGLPARPGGAEGERNPAIEPVPSQNHPKHRKRSLIQPFNFTSMKTYLKIAALWLALTAVMYIAWMTGFSAGMALFPSDLQQADAAPERTMLLLLAVCAINTAVMMLFMLKSSRGGIVLAASSILLIFGIQFFLSQIETLWFNDALQMPLNGIAAIVAGGLIMSVIFGSVATPMLNGVRKKLTSGSPDLHAPYRQATFWTRVLLLSVFVYPMLYMLAGYFIAWQAPAVREYYSGNPMLTMSFFESFMENIRNGLIPYQFLRGLLWILIGLPVLHLYQGPIWLKAVTLGLLYAMLMNSQHLLPNPYFPDEVQLVHFIETASSNFIWGMAVAYGLGPLFNTQRKQPQNSLQMA
jgi:DNA-binding MarR family transcriptional regulator